MRIRLAKVVGKRGPPPTCRDFGGLKGPGELCNWGTVWGWGPIYSTGKRELFHDDFCQVTVLSAGTYNTGIMIPPYTK